MAKPLDISSHDIDNAVAHHFDDTQQQHEAAELGMWLFLVTEIMFFGGAFTAYLVYRNWYLDAFILGSHTMNRLLGSINTVALLTSSLTMALSVYAVQHRRNRLAQLMLICTILLGTAFLGVKAYEYHHKYEEQLIPFATNYQPPDNALFGIETFFNLYFAMTGLHAFHMIIGIALLVWVMRLVGRGIAERQKTVTHNIGLYWHFVDLVWVYLFPFFYLVGE